MTIDEMSKRRLQNTTVACPVVYGSMALSMGKKQNEYATHKWRLYLRGPNDEDLSTFIAKVVFTLHPSFMVPVREITKSPFEVTETGWGEFEATLRIFFRDPEESPLDLCHLIKLYHTPTAGSPSGHGTNSTAALGGTKSNPVVAEAYDEFVFTNPTEDFMQMLMLYKAPSRPEDRVPSDIASFYRIFSEEDDIKSLGLAQNTVNAELERARADLIRLDAEITNSQLTIARNAQKMSELTSRGKSMGLGRTMPGGAIGAPPLDLGGQSNSQQLTPAQQQQRQQQWLLRLEQLIQMPPAQLQQQQQQQLLQLQQHQQRRVQQLHDQQQPQYQFLMQQQQQQQQQLLEQLNMSVAERTEKQKNLNLLQDKQRGQLQQRQRQLQEHLHEKHSSQLANLQKQHLYIFSHQQTRMREGTIGVMPPNLLQLQQQMQVFINLKQSFYLIIFQNYQMIMLNRNIILLI